MAFGLHWEWRGFGAVSSQFAGRFRALEPQREPHFVEDLYLWIPGLDVNVKLRQGAEEGLKFKRRLGADGSLEQWLEDPEESFDLPLDQQGWEKLRRTLAVAGVSLPAHAPRVAVRQQILRILEEQGCRTVLVQKWREGRLWPGPSGPVIVEWTCIHTPQVITSVGLENLPADLGGEAMTDRQARAAIRAAISALELAREPIAVMNFLTAVALWATGEKIAHQ